MAVGLVSRYIWLINQVERPGGISFEDIDYAWQRCTRLNPTGEPLPKKTFHNHIGAIEEMFNLRITCNRKAGYRYYIEKLECPKEETIMLKWLMQSFSINALWNENAKLRERIIFEDVPSGQLFLTPIVEAMRDGECVRITHRSFDKEEATAIEIEPWCVKLFKQRWYVLGKRDSYAVPHIYALDRIEAVDSTNHKFRLPKGFNAEEFFADYYGIMFDKENDKVERIVLSADTLRANYLRTLPLHHSQREVKQRGDKTIFEYRLCPSFDFFQKLLSFGESVEVLEPTSLRDTILRELVNMCINYGLISMTLSNE